MKLLEINVCSGCKSTGRIASDIANLFCQKNGNEAVIAYGRGYLDAGVKTYKITTKNQVRLDALKTRIFDNAGFNNKSATLKFIKWIKSYDPDIIHLHNIHGYYINIAVLFQYLKVCGKRIIWTLHDCWSFTGHCSHFDYIKCDRWKSGCYNCPQKNEYPASILADRSEKNYKQKKELFTGIPNLTIVAPSQWLADLVKQSFMKDYPVQVINNGIDLETFKPTESDLKKRFNLNDKKVLLGVASPWSDRKGFSDFIKLSKSIPENYVIVLIGLNKNQISVLPKNIIGITRTNSKLQLAQWYSLSDVFVNPTVEDTYPTVNLEAQACGTPVITYKTGGSVESVPPKHVVEQGNVEQLQSKIIEVLNSDTPAIFSPTDASYLCKKYIELISE